MATGDLLTAEARARIRARVLAMPPLTDEQIDALADTLDYLRRRRTTKAPTEVEANVLINMPGDQHANEAAGCDQHDAA